MPDQIILDIPLIRRYSRHNEPADIKFAASIKQSNLSNVELDGKVHEATDEVWKQIDCTTCANCCRTLQIVVSDSDIQRLSQRFKIAVQQFRRTYVAVATDGVAYFKSSPCSFLGADNRCSVYEDRPQACRDYPYLLEPGFRKRAFTTVENASTCPIVFNTWQLLKRRIGHGKH